MLVRLVLRGQEACDNRRAQEIDKELILGRAKEVGVILDLLDEAFDRWACAVFGVLPLLLVRHHVLEQMKGLLMPWQTIFFVLFVSSVCGKSVTADLKALVHEVRDAARYQTNSKVLADLQAILVLAEDANHRHRNKLEEEGTFSVRCAAFALGECTTRHLKLHSNVQFQGCSEDFELQDHSGIILEKCELPVQEGGCMKEVEGKCGSRAGGTEEQTFQENLDVQTTTKGSRLICEGNAVKWRRYGASASSLVMTYENGKYIHAAAFNHVRTSLALSSEELEDLVTANCLKTTCTFLDPTQYLHWSCEQ
eukprot:c6641_g1_i2.p1 GENE.c6641_g1_i2~~c6641_g1_i2.p1  ORF type:complete len:309 (-),score=30.18 c6641_g1_i2:24-950(-)